jgi:hypothetical protein
MTILNHSICSTDETGGPLPLVEVEAVHEEHEEGGADVGVVLGPILWNVHDPKICTKLSWQHGLVVVSYVPADVCAVSSNPARVWGGSFYFLTYVQNLKIANCKYGFIVLLALWFEKIQELFSN